MTALEAVTRIREQWRKRANEIRDRLTTIRLEEIALKDLLRTIEAQETAADLAVTAAKEAPPKRRVSS